MQYIALYLIFSMFAILWLDVTRYKIPNIIVGSLLILYPIAVYAAAHPIDWQMALAAMLVTFIGGYIIFMFRIMGGGDIKLITVLALWVGWQQLLEFVFAFALIGGIFSLIILIARKIEPYVPRKRIIKLPVIMQKDAPIPYGVAITLAFLWMMWLGHIPVLR